MNLKLRPYQTRAVADIRGAFASKIKRELFVLPTGGGKSIVFAYITNGAMKKGNRTIILAHRNELIRQISKMLTKLGIVHGIIAPKHSLTDDLIQVASVQTLVRRLDKVRPPNFIIADEGHHSVSPVFRRIFDKFSEAKILAVTATPLRLDGRGLGEVFEHMTLGPSPADLMRDGWLSDYVVYGPPSDLDLSGVHRSGGDYNRTEVADAVARSSIMGDAVAHYLKLLPGEPVIVFAPSVKHSIEIAERFNAAGVPAAHIDGGSDKGERERAVSDFEAGRIKVLCNVEIVTEGFDVPKCSGVILLRPTESVGLFLQMIGRALRPDLEMVDGELRPSAIRKKAIIIDHVGATFNLGMPDEERVWTLGGIEKKPKKSGDDVKIKQCPRCYSIFPPAPACPTCAFEFPIKSRRVDEKEGELVELTADKVAKERARREAIRQKSFEQSQAKTIEDLVALGRQRGMKNPYPWARIILAARADKEARKKAS